MASFDESRYNASVRRSPVVSLDATLQPAEAGEGDAHEPLLKDVSFRAMEPAGHGGERATHFIHAYPAKMLAKMGQHILREATELGDRSIVADPFCGSGTVPLEAVLRGCRAVGSDVNPLGLLITRVKTTPIDLAEVEAGLQSVLRWYVECDGSDVKPPAVINIEYWYSSATINRLSRLRSAIERVSKSSVQDFFWVAFSAVVRLLSNTDLRMSVPVRLKPERLPPSHPLSGRLLRRAAFLETADAGECFARAVFVNLARQRSFQNELGARASRVCVFDWDTRTDPREDVAGCVDFLLTSPPYCGAQKYVRATSLSMGWLGLCAPDQLATMERSTIGREHLPRHFIAQAPSPIGIDEADELIQSVFADNPLRGHIAREYLGDMEQAACHFSKLVRDGGRVCLVLGDSQVAGRVFPTQRFVVGLMRRYGWVPVSILRDEIKARAMSTRRNTTASLIHHETVTTFQRFQ